MIFIFLAFAVAGQALDLLTTSAGLHAGVVKEVNPVASFAYNRFGLAGLTALKVLYVALAFSLGRAGLAIAGFIGLGFAVWNLLQLRKAGYFKG